MSKNHGIDYKIHKDEASVQIRITEAQNGYLVKAGRKPFICQTREKVQQAVTDILGGYFDWAESPERRIAGG
jgi:hypothetical protein